jgi:ribosome-associated translation inhibitor RaiA
METPLRISYRGLQSSPAIEQQIREWASRLDALYARIQRCDVVVEAPHRHQRQGQQFHVRVTLGVPGGPLVVSHDPGPDEAHQDVHVAVRDAFQALRRQLEDHVRHHLQRDI